MKSTTALVGDVNLTAPWFLPFSLCVHVAAEAKEVAASAVKQTKGSIFMLYVAF